MDARRRVVFMWTYLMTLFTATVLRLYSATCDLLLSVCLSVCLFVCVSCVFVFLWCELNYCRETLCFDVDFNNDMAYLSSWTRRAVICNLGLDYRLRSRNGWPRIFFLSYSQRPRGKDVPIFCMLGDLVSHSLHLQLQSMCILWRHSFRRFVFH